MPTQPKMYIPPDAKEDVPDDDEGTRQEGLKKLKKKMTPARPEVVPAPDTGNPTRPNPGSPTYNLNLRPKL